MRQVTVLMRVAQIVPVTPAPSRIRAQEDYDSAIREIAMTLKRCTLAGVDEATPLFELAVISDLHPFVEWGLLFSPTKQGLRGRHPTVERIQRALRELPGYVNLSLHVREEGVPLLLGGEPLLASLFQQLRSRGGRVKLDCDFAERKVDRAALRRFLLDHADVKFITRHNEKNAPVTQSLAGVPNHCVLFEAATGSVGPGAWPAASPMSTCGYAGNLGPETLEKALPRIYEAAAHNEFWIELEGRLRDPNDRFDLRAARTCLEIVGSEMTERMQMPKNHPRRRQCELIDLVSLTRENDIAGEFEIMLRRLVEATADVLDPRVLDMRRKAQNLLRTKGTMSLLRPEEPIGQNLPERLTPG